MHTQLSYHMRPLILAAVALTPAIALAAPAPQQPPPIVQACAQSATDQMQQAIVWHAQAIADGQQIAALRAQVAKLTPKPKAKAPVHPTPKPKAGKVPALSSP